MTGIARTLDGEAVRYGDDHPLLSREIALVDLLDRLLAGGVVLTGDITLAIADVDLVHISLRAIISSVCAGPGGPSLPGTPDARCLRMASAHRVGASRLTPPTTRASHRFDLRRTE